MRSITRKGFGMVPPALLAVSMLACGFQTTTGQVLKASVKPLKIRAIVGKDTVRVGDVETYRVIINDPRDVEYRWSTGDRSAFGNPVVHKFKRPGTLKVIVTARNVVSTARDSLTITVLGPEPPATATAASTAPIGVDVPDKPTSAGSTGAVEPTKPAPAPVVGGASPDEKDAVSMKTSSASSSFRGAERVSQNSSGFTWVVATYFQRPPAVALANSYRASGYRSGVITDDEGLGSRVFRVILGEFDTEASALRARRHLLNAGYKNVLLREL